MKSFNSFLVPALCMLVCMLVHQTVWSQEMSQLSVYWNQNNLDYFTTATESEKAEIVKNGYIKIEDSGWIFKEQQPGTVPLNLYWSESRKDAVTTASEHGNRDATGLDYTFIKIEGYVYPEQKPGTVPLKFFWNLNRTDNLITATASGEKAATTGGYSFQRIEGYVYQQKPAPSTSGTGDLSQLLPVTLPDNSTIYVHPRDNSTDCTWGVDRRNPDIEGVKETSNQSKAENDFTGKANTEAIVAQLGSNSGNAYAAKICADLVAYGFDDWYLPAAGELWAIFQQLGPDGQGQITTGTYLSSTEYDSRTIWHVEFVGGHGGGYLANGYKSNNGMNCRCVRKGLN